MKYVFFLSFAFFWLSFSAPVSAQEAPKNVQVLKDLSQAELRRAMGFMKTSLGVRCDFCHVNGGPGGPWHFDADAKESKKTARKMIQMVMDINRQNFDGKPVVSCFTCHQGSIKPPSTVSLPYAPPTSAAAEETQEKPTDLPTAALILDRYHKAIGVDPNHQPFWKSIVMKGKRETASEMADLEIRAKLPTRWLMVINGPQSKMKMATDGKTFWMQEDEGIEEMDSVDQQRFQEAIHGFQLVPNPAKDYTVRGQVDVSGKKAYQLNHRTDEHTSESLFFDVETGLLLKMLIQHETPVGRVPEQYEYEDYKKAGTLLLPFTTRCSFADPRSNNIKRLELIQVDADVPDQDFVMPSQPQTAP
jgi:hypothetical protein